MLKVVSIIGARPQFIKSFPFERAAKGNIDLITIHTGQHFDTNMSQIFFDEFGMNKPNYLLSFGGGMHGEQTGKMLIEIEKILLAEKPDFVLVFGDTNSTLAGALAAAKLNIKIVHVESGLRSFNKSMPEEVNRILTDHLSTLLYVPSESALMNLKNEGIISKVYNVGDIMKDVVFIYKELYGNNVIKEDFIYATIHRPYNTDNADRLAYILKVLNDMDKPVLFSIHPRTSKLMKEFKMLESDFPNIHFCSPFGYFDNLRKLDSCFAFITDSGGMQKEAYWLKKKCITIRTETEWVETLNNNWNTLVFDDLSNLNDLISQNCGAYEDLYGYGNSGELIVASILNYGQ